MIARLVHLLTYDPIKGRGVFKFRKHTYTFSYKAFEGEVQIKSKRAVLTDDGILRPATISHRIKGLFGRTWKWQ